MGYQPAWLGHPRGTREVGRSALAIVPTETGTATEASLVPVQRSFTGHMLNGSIAGQHWVTAQWRRTGTADGGGVRGIPIDNTEHALRD